MTDVERTRLSRGLAIAGIVLAGLAWLLALCLVWFLVVYAPSMSDSGTSTEEQAMAGMFVFIGAGIIGGLMLLADVAGLGLGIAALVRGERLGWTTVIVSCSLVIACLIVVVAWLLAAGVGGLLGALVVLLYVAPIPIEGVVYRRVLDLELRWAFLTSLAANIAGLLAIPVVGVVPVLGEWLTLPAMLGAEVAVVVAMNSQYADRRRLLAVSAIVNVVTLTAIYIAAWLVG